MPDSFAHMQTVKRTRKVHRCYECQEEIEIGTEAAKVSGRHDGAFFSDYSHSDCHRAALYYIQVAGLDLYEGWVGLWEEMGQFGPTDDEFVHTLEMFREEGWDAVAVRLMRRKEND